MNAQPRNPGDCNWAAMSSPSARSRAFGSSIASAAVAIRSSMASWAPCR